MIENVLRFALVAAALSGALTVRSIATGLACWPSVATFATLAGTLAVAALRKWSCAVVTVVSGFVEAAGVGGAAIE